VYFVKAKDRKHGVYTDHKQKEGQQEGADGGQDLTEQLKMAQERSSGLEAQVRDAVGRLVSCATERDQLKAALEEERIGRKEDQAALERGESRNGAFEIGC
ncbi:unnamed protein product, partial [Linum tenue]